MKGIHACGHFIEACLRQGGSSTSHPRFLDTPRTYDYLGPIPTTGTSYGVRGEPTFQAPRKTPLVGRQTFCNLTGPKSVNVLEGEGRPVASKHKKKTASHLLHSLRLRLHVVHIFPAFCCFSRFASNQGVQPSVFPFAGTQYFCFTGLEHNARNSSICSVRHVPIRYPRPDRLRPGSAHCRRSACLYTRSPWDQVSEQESRISHFFPFLFCFHSRVTSAEINRSTQRLFVLALSGGPDLDPKLPQSR